MFSLDERCPHCGLGAHDGACPPEAGPRGYALKAPAGGARGGQTEPPRSTGVNDELISALERACITLRVILGRLHDPQDDQQRASVARVRYVIEQGEGAIAKAKGHNRHVHTDCPFCICEPTR